MSAIKKPILKQNDPNCYFAKHRGAPPKPESAKEEAESNLLNSCKWLRNIIDNASDGGRVWVALCDQPGAEKWFQQFIEAIAKAESTRI